MLVNKRITVGNANILKFFFPNYSLVNETNIPDDPKKPAIYNGTVESADRFINSYRNAGQDYIVVGIYSDIDLTDRRILANVAFEKWRKGYFPKYLDLIVDNLDYNIFLEEIKLKWVTGKWTIKEVQDENSFLDLVDSLNKSKLDFMKTYFGVIDSNSSYVIESSVLTFLNRAKTCSYTGTSFNYKKKLDLYKGKKLDNALNAINDSLEYNIDNYDLKLLNLMINIIDNGKKR